MISGFLVVDKPVGITSHDVVSVLRAMLGIKKIGHTGTLDPFATGVLPMAIGPSTRLIQFLDESTKIYDATVQLGASTDTGDLTGEVAETKPVPALEFGEVQRVLDGFVGDRMQVPPAYSAVKVDGKALYKYAREGNPVKAKARPIHIQSMTLSAVSKDTIELQVRCSRGTYVRVIAEEIGESLGTKGHLIALRRLASGPFELDRAIDFPSLSVLAAGNPDWRPVLRPRRGEERVQWREQEALVADLLPRFVDPYTALSHLPEARLSEDDLQSLRLRGRVLSVPEPVEDGGHWLAFDGENMLGVLQRDGAIGRVARMLNQG
jgi:tRNA pseudouridine55 synthase